MDEIILNINSLDRTRLLVLAKKLKLRGLSNKKRNVIRNVIIEEITSKKINKINDVSINVANKSRSKLSKKVSQIPVKLEKTLSYKYPIVKKLYVIGDLHGDLNATIQCLKLAGVISQDIDNNTNDIRTINWTGGSVYVVQLGDQIDRVRPSKLFNNMCKDDDPELCDDEGSDLKIICLFNKLHNQAIKQNGACLSILGNHELMNVEGDFRYVSPKEFREFGNYFKGDKSNKNSHFPFGYTERKDAFKPGGTIARLLAVSRFSVLQVGSWLFVHGGITSPIANKYKLEDINTHIRNWLLNNDMNHDAIDELYHNDDDSQSPFWSRTYSDISEYDNSCTVEFERTIKILNAMNDTKGVPINGMIVGHSPQFMYNKGINSECNNRLWRVDVGMSRAFGELNQKNDDYNHRKIQILLIENDSKFSIINSI
jgi:hypothetical protein